MGALKSSVLSSPTPLSAGPLRGKLKIGEQLAPMNPLDEANKKFAQGEFDSAVALLEEAAKSPDLRHDALGNLAWALSTRSRFEEALDAYTRLIEHSPADAGARALRARTLVKLGRTEDGLSEAISVLMDSPHNKAAASVVREAQDALDPAPPEPSQLRTSSKVINPVIKKLEEDTVSYPSSADPRIGAFLYSMVRMVQPRVLIATGTFVGYSALCMAQAMEDNGGGHLDSFDLFLDHERYHSPYTESRDAQEIVLTHLKEADLAHRVTLHKGRSQEEMGKFFATRSEENKVDFAFIDGDHSINGCLKDMEVVARQMNPGGIIVLHDTNPEHCTWLGPRFAIEEGVGDYFRWANLPTPDGYGLAIVQKADERDWQATLPSLWTLAKDRLFVSSRWKNGQNHEFNHRQTRMDTDDHGRRVAGSAHLMDNRCGSPRT